MNHFLRPYYHFEVAILLGLGMAVAPPGAGAQSSGIAQAIEGTSPVLTPLHRAISACWVDDVD